MDLNQPLEKLIAAADNHGEDEDPDHTVGDLQDLLRRSWEIMGVSQRLQLLRSDEAESVILHGARDEFDAEALVAEVQSDLAAMESSVNAAGYVFMEGEGGFFWETEEDVSEDFHERWDAIADAHEHMEQRAKDSQAAGEKPKA